MTIDPTTPHPHPHLPTPAPPAPSAPAPPPTAWTSWQLHLGSPARSLHDRVVTDVVAPVVASAGDPPWFFLRYWQGGPHVRLRLGGLDRSGAAEVTDDLRARLAVAGQLRAGEEPVDEAAYRRGAARASYGESDADRVVQGLRAPGVHPGSYEPELERYGGQQHMAVSEQVFQLSSELVAAFLRHRPSAVARAALAVRGTAAAAAAVGGVTEQSVFSAYGLRSLQGMARAQGHSAEQVDAWCRVSGRTGPEPDDAGPLAPWRRQLATLAESLAATWSGSAQAHPGAVLASHVHMLHNRLGLGPVEEMRTYAWLASASASAFPELVGAPRGAA